MIPVEIRRLENKLDALDIDDPQYHILEAQLNTLLDEYNHKEDIKEQEEIARQEQVRLAGHRERITSKYGDYNTWFAWARSFYTITSDYVVISNAKDWEEEKSWEFTSYIDCLEKVEQLVYWRYYNDFLRIKKG